MISISNRIVSGVMSGVASAVLVVAAVPAHAADPKGTEAPPPVQSATGDFAKPAVKKYCLKETITGSHMPTKICKTKDEWESEGIDVTAK